MKALLVLGMFAFMQFLPNLGCNCAPPGPPPAPPPPVAYVRCPTENACDPITPTCGPAGMCTKSCASDSDCPFGPPIRSDPFPPGACIRFDGGAPFCTYYIRGSDDECFSDGWFAPTRAFTSAANGLDGGSHVCLPTSLACGDGECGLFSESIVLCPADCAFRNCFPGSSCRTGEASQCVGIQVPDAGSLDVVGEPIRLKGLCIRLAERACLPDGGCTAGRASFPAICQAGFSAAPTCFQTCTAVGKDSDCHVDQRCVAGATPGVAICVPLGSLR